MKQEKVHFNDDTINVQFTDEEYAQIEANAEEVGMSVEEYILWKTMYAVYIETLQDEQKKLKLAIKELNENPSEEAFQSSVKVMERIFEAAEGIKKCDNQLKEVQARKG